MSEALNTLSPNNAQDFVLEEPKIVYCTRYAAELALYANDIAPLIKLRRQFSRAERLAYQRASAPDVGENSTPWDMITYSLASEAPTTRLAVEFVRQLQRSANAEQHHQTNAANGWRPEMQALRDRQRWRHSGLQLASISPIRTPQIGASYAHLGIEPSSVTEAMSNGSIMLLFPGQSGIARLLHGYCRQVLRREVSLAALSAYTHASLPEPQPERETTVRGTQYFELFTRIFAETNSREYTGKHLKGPFYQAFADRLALLDSHLRAIDPALDPTFLHAQAYQRPRNYYRRPDHWSSEGIALDNLYKSRNSYFLPVAEATYSQDRNVVFEPGILACPPYISSRGVKTCASTCFRMIFADITGDMIEEREMVDPMGELLGDTVVHQEDLLKVFDSMAFKDEYEKTVITLAFTGMSLLTINTICQKLRARNSECRIYWVANTRTRTSPDRNVWHNVVVTDVDQDTVTFHDPSKNKLAGGANEKIPKRGFHDLWACTYNSGYLVVAP